MRNREVEVDLTLRERLVMSDGRISWPWRRQPGESRQAFAAFEVYRDGATRGARSIRRSARKLGKSRQLLERWSVRWRWVERCDKYDFAVHRLRWARHAEEVAERAAQEAREREAARFAPFYEDLRAAALVLPLGDLMELLRWEGLGEGGTETTPIRGDAPDPRLGGRTTGDERAPRGR